MLSGKFRRLRRLLSSILAIALLVAVLLPSAASAASFTAPQAVADHLQQNDWSNLQGILSGIYGSVSSPLLIKDLDKGGYTTGQLLGNGDIGVVAAGVSTTSQQFYFGKNDFWGTLHAQGSSVKDNAGILSCGGLDIWPTTAAGSNAPSVFKMKQDLLNAQVTTNIQLKDNSGNDANIQMNSWTADADNVFVTEITNNGTGDITLNTKQWVPAMAYASGSATDLTDAQNTYPYTGGIDTTTYSTPILWTTRDTNAGSSGNTSGFRSRLSAATTVVGSALTNTQEKTEANDYYDSNKGRYYNSLGESGDFTVPAGQTVNVVTYFTSSSGRYTDVKSVSQVQQDAVQGILAYTTQEAVNQLKTDHLNWWKNYWLKSYVQFNDAALNQYYYGSLYIQGCANRPTSPNGKVNPQNLPGSMYGAWIPADNVGWGGRYFLNYNQQAEYYAAGSTNRIDTAVPFNRVIAYDLPWQMNNAAAQGFDGAVHVRTLSPFDLMANPQPPLNEKNSTQKWGFNSGSTDQKSNGMFSAVPMIFYYEYTLDDNFLKTVLYPYLKQLLTFYSSYVLKTDDGNGQYHYSVIGSSIHEGDAADINPDLDIGAIKRLSGFLLDHASAMNEDPSNIARWKDLLDHTAFPEAMLPQGTFSAANNTNFVPTLLATDYQSPNQAHVDMIEPGDQPVELEGVVFPLENVQVLDGDRELLQKVNNTLAYMNAWASSNFAGWSSPNNGFCKVYPIAARSGWPAADLLSKFKAALSAKVRLSNLTYYASGGAVETIGAMEGLDSMLMQSSTSSSVPSTIQVFPNWDMTKSVTYERLGAMGNVEVSSAYDADLQTVPYVDLNSRRDGKIALVNPWTTGTPVIRIVNPDNTLGDNVDYTISGGKIVFDAVKGTRYMVMADTGDTTAHVSGITLDKYSSTLVFNGTNGTDAAVITAAISGNPGDTVTWASSDPSVVSVADNGNNTATIKAAGTGSNLVADAIITTTSTQDPGVTQTCKVKVADVSTVPTSLTMVSPSAASLYGPSSTSSSTGKVSGTDRLQLTASIQPGNAYDKRIMWTSSDQSLAMVDKNGLVTARGQGTVTITGTSMANPGLAPITCTVTVKAAGNDYAADATLASVINAAKSISSYSGNTTGSGGFTRISGSAGWEGMQESFQKAYINALGVKSGYSGYSQFKISKDTAYFAAVALNEAIKAIDPEKALAISNVPDKTALAAAIKNANLLTPANFGSQNDWAVLQAALSTAITVNDNTNASQDEVDSAISALKAAMANVLQSGGTIPSVNISSGSYNVYGGHLIQVNAAAGMAWSVTNPDGSATSNAVIDPNGGLLFAAAEGTYKVTAKSGSGDPQVILITFSNMSPMPNLTVNNSGNGTAFGSTSSGSYPPVNAFDGNSGTFYDHSSSTPYVGWDFGSGNAKVINVLKFQPRSGSNGARVNGAILQGSNTSASSGYTNLYTITDTPPSVSNQAWYVKAIPNTTAYRYYRWLGVNGSHANVAEMQLYLNVDKTALGNELAFAQSQQEGNYTADSWSALQTALTDALVDFNNQSSMQTQIDESAASLQSAISGLQIATDGALYVANGITSVTAPVKDATRLELPGVHAGFTITVKSSDNTAVIDTDGSIVPPDAETPVDLVLTVTRTFDGLTADTASIPVIVPARRIITSIATVSINTLAGVEPVLPSQVSVVYNDDSVGQVAVAWDAIDPQSYAQSGPGIFIVEGTVARSAIKATANVTVERAPVLTTIGDRTVDEAQTLTFAIEASDPDGDAIAYSTGTLPAGASFDAATHQFTWTPDYTQAGSYPVHFEISDGILTASEDITVTVNDVLPGDQITSLKASVEGSKSNKGIKNSLTVKLDNALISLMNDKNNTVNMLNAFINEITSLGADGTLTKEEADKLIKLAQEIILNINSSK